MRTTRESQNRIETGRHQRPIIPRENRFCFICANKIEDEQHFLLECKLYGSQNKFTRLIENSDDTFTTLTNDEKFIHLMTQDDEQTTEHIAKEIRSRQNLRDLIYEYFFQPEKNPLDFDQTGRNRTLCTSFIPH